LAALTSPPRRVFHLSSWRLGAAARILAMLLRATKTTSKSRAAAKGGAKG